MFRYYSVLPTFLPFFAAVLTVYLVSILFLGFNVLGRANVVNLFILGRCNLSDFCVATEYLEFCNN